MCGFVAHGQVNREMTPVGVLVGWLSSARMALSQVGDHFCLVRSFSLLMLLGKRVDEYLIIRLALFQAFLSLMGLAVCVYEDMVATSTTPGP
jgi:hypothetical protein